MRKIFSISLLMVLSSVAVHAQTSKRDTTFNRCYIGSTLFVLGNFVPDDPNPPGFVQINFGYWLAKKDVVSIELKTWKYAFPLGIPYGDSYNAPEEKYPGHIRDIGFALVYQRFIWKGAYAAVHAMNARQKYFNEDGDEIQKGYQLFMTYRVGYQFTFFKDRLFIEPSVAMTQWPIRTNVPEAFAAKDSKWPSYFAVEPGLHFGVKF